MNESRRFLSIYLIDETQLW